jgi:hypothetical protein
MTVTGKITFKPRGSFLTRIWGPPHPPGTDAGPAAHLARLHGSDEPNEFRITGVTPGATA